MVVDAVQKSAEPMVSDALFGGIAIGILAMLALLALITALERTNHKG